MSGARRGPVINRVLLMHADDIRNRLTDAQLAIVPGTSHAIPMEKPDLVNRLILDFLSDSQTPKVF
jgi:pimeloyl-ACP methyl ester carboxylesterase